MHHKTQLEGMFYRWCLCGTACRDTNPTPQTITYYAAAAYLPTMLPLQQALHAIRHTNSLRYCYRLRVIRPCRPVDLMCRLAFGRDVEGPTFYGVTYISLFVIYLLAMALPSIWKPLQLIGATAGRHASCNALSFTHVHRGT